MSFPYEFLPLLPNLEILHLYGIGRSREKTFKDGFPLLRMAKLRLGRLMEVRLQAGALWRRATVYDTEWNMRLDKEEPIPFEDNR